MDRRGILWSWRIEDCGISRKWKKERNFSLSKLEKINESIGKLESCLRNSYLNGFRSMQTFCETSFKKPAGDSWTTCWTRRRVFKYSVKRLRKAIKCSALLILPGTTSEKCQAYYFFLILINVENYWLAIP